VTLHAAPPRVQLLQRGSVPSHLTLRSWHLAQALTRRAAGGSPAALWPVGGMAEEAGVACGVGAGAPVGVAAADSESDCALNSNSQLIK
jgi:hypothetical protein